MWDLSHGAFGCQFSIDLFGTTAPEGQVAAFTPCPPRKGAIRVKGGLVGCKKRQEQL